MFQSMPYGSINELFNKNRVLAHAIEGPNHLNPLSFQLSYANPAEVYDPRRHLDSNAKLPSLIFEACDCESAHDSDPPPKKLSMW